MLRPLVHTSVAGVTGLHGETPPSWSDASVFLDFDGTVTAVDTCSHLLRRLSGPDWDAPGRLFREGSIDGRACLTREWEMLSHDLSVLEETAAEIPLDPSLDALLARMASLGVEATVLSDGFGFWAERVIAGRIPVYTNRIVDGVLTFPYADPDCDHGCGVCKQPFVRRAAQRGRVTVVVGDGTSDVHAAALADVIFAKDGLAAWCDRHRPDYSPIHGLVDVLTAMSFPLSDLLAERAGRTTSLSAKELD